MKKILAILGSVTLVMLSTTTIVACGANSLNDKPSFPKDEFIYELFGNTFLSEEDAIEYYLRNESGLKKKTKKDYQSTLYLGEEIFNDAGKMHNYIKKNIPIKKLSTSKNRDDYKIDGMNQLNSNVLTSEDEKIKVYRDSSGKAVYNYNETSSENEVLDSYYKNIDKKYYADSTVFNSTNELYNHFEKKFINEEGNIIESDLYNYNGPSYTEKNLEIEIEKDIRAAYKYNGRVFSDSDINQPGIITPSLEDKAKINSYSKTPGQYLVEQKSGSGGTYTGDQIIEADTDLAKIIYDQSKWTKKSEKSKNLFDVVESSIVTGVTMGSAALIKKLKKGLENDTPQTNLQNCFIDSNKMSARNLFACFTTESNFNKYNDLMHDYEVFAESSNIMSKLNSVESLDTMPKVIIYLYQMREEFRNSNVKVLDNIELNKIYYELFKNFYDDLPSWDKILDILMTEDISLLLDFLLDKNSFFKIIETKNFKNELQGQIGILSDEMKVTYSSPELAEVLDFLDKNLDVAAKYVGAAVSIVKDKLLLLGKQVPILGAIIEFLEDFTLQTTITYELKLPDSDKVLTYEMSNWFFENKKFIPEDVFRVFEIREPRANKTFLIDGKYFPTYELALKQLERNIVIKTVNEGPDHYYLKTDTNKQYTDKSKEKVKNYWKTEYMKKKVDSRYTDYMGGEYLVKIDAFEGMKKKLRDEKFLEATAFYSYNYGDNEENIVYFKNLDEMKDFVKFNVDLKTKEVTLLDLQKNNYIFDNLHDLTQFNEDIYHFNLFGMDYYFCDVINATYKIMQILNYKNVLTQTSFTTYHLNGKDFENIVNYQQYLFKNIKKIKKDSQELIKGGLN